MTSWHCAPCQTTVTWAEPIISNPGMRKCLRCDEWMDLVTEDAVARMKGHALEVGLPAGYEPPAMRPLPVALPPEVQGAGIIAAALDRVAAALVKLAEAAATEKAG